MLVLLIYKYSFFTDGGVVPISDCISSKLHPQRRNTSQVDVLNEARANSDLISESKTCLKLFPCDAALLYFGKVRQNRNFVSMFFEGLSLSSVCLSV